MFSNDHELKAQALTLWANHIETGKVTLSAQDLKGRGQEKDINVLSTEQKDLVSRIRLLAVEELKVSSKLSLATQESSRPVNRNYKY